MTSTEAEQLAAIKDLRGPRIIIEFDALALFNIVAAVQLALRHPGMGDYSRALLVEFVAHAKAKLAPEGGPVADSIDRGNDPDEDVSA